MSTGMSRGARQQLGMVLITSLLLLLVVTILALAMFRGVGLEGRIAGNVMDKQRALQAATSTEDYAEQWLVGNVLTESQTPCSAATFAAATVPVICSNTLASSTDAASAATVPWKVGNAGVGLPYSQIVGAANIFPVNANGGVANQYFQTPTVYIAQLGYDATAPTAVDYQIDAWSYGGNSGTVAVVESTYQIRYIAEGGGGP